MKDISLPTSHNESLLVPASLCIVVGYPLIATDFIGILLIPVPLIGVFLFVAGLLKATKKHGGDKHFGSALIFFGGICFMAACITAFPVVLGAAIDGDLLAWASKAGLLTAIFYVLTFILFVNGILLRPTQKTGRLVKATMLYLVLMPILTYAISILFYLN